MNLDERVIDLVQYRLKSSKERLNSARILLENKQRGSVVPVEDLMKIA